MQTEKTRSIFTFPPLPRGANGSGFAGVFGGTYPVHNEDLADIEPLLQELGGDGHRVEVTESPENGR